MPLRRLARLIHVALTLARHDALIPEEYAAGVPPVVRLIGKLTRGTERRQAGDTPGQRLAAALERLGPVYAKFGQFLATRPDLVGMQTALDLARLKDRMAPFPRAQAVAAIRAAFGADAERLFGDLSALPEATAAASLAQVHRWTLPDGREVALKVLRPGIEAQVKRDGDAMRLGARLAEALIPGVRRLRPAAAVQVVLEALEKELDFRFEAASASAFIDSGAGAPFMEAPSPDWERTGPRVLTLDWIEGAPLSDDAAVEALGVDRPALGTAVVRGFLQGALDHGYFHADLHEGNLIALGGDRLAAVDFGIMGRIGPNERRFLAEILWGFLRRDYRRVAEVHFEAGYVPADRSLDDFSLAIRAVGEPIFGRGADAVSMGRVLMQLWETTERFGMKLRPELVLLQKTMVQAEGVGRALDPNLNIWDAARPIVEAWIRRELGPPATARRAIEDAAKGLAALRKLPELTEALEAFLAKAGRSSSR